MQRGVRSRQAAGGEICRRRIRREALPRDVQRLIGPKGDPAGIKGSKDIAAALKAIKAKGVTFISRGDKSGTDAAELALWKVAGIDCRRRGGGRAQHGVRVQRLCPGGSWHLALIFRNRGELVVAVEGDKRIFNQYGLILVNPARHAHVKTELGQQFIDWLISPEGQKAIANYKINGEQLFYPNAGDPGA
jgi:tungstate transport system substrate-binding protein